MVIFHVFPPLCLNAYVLYVMLFHMGHVRLQHIFIRLLRLLNIILECFALRFKPACPLVYLFVCLPVIWVGRCLEQNMTYRHKFSRFRHRTRTTFVHTTHKGIKLNDTVIINKIIEVEYHQYITLDRIVRT